MYAYTCGRITYIYIYEYENETGEKRMTDTKNEIYFP